VNDETEDAASSLVGQQLGPYLIESLLGSGGMGEVYRARDTRLERTVAIKVLPRDNTASLALKRRFLQEARAISALNHPNIVILYDIGSDRGTDFLVLEYVPGQTLRQMIVVEPLPLADVLHFGVQIAHALAAAHGKGLTHRDLKPANIIVTPESQIKVLDFGIAELMEGIGARVEAQTRTLEAAWTTPGMVVGTLAYMSPEQTRGESLDGRSDIFSLGCVLYEAATGVQPFRGASVLSVMHAIAAQEPPAPSALRRELPSEFDRVLESALAKERDRRYSSAAALAEALQAMRGEVRPTSRVRADRPKEALVGREPEMRKLQDLLATAIAGSGTIVFLTGEPGRGKSALADAFISQARRDCPDVLVGRGACMEQFGAGEAYLPFLEALSGLLSTPSRDRVTTALRQAPTWCLQLPALLVSPGAFEKLQGEVIGATKERMLREFGDAISDLASARPVVLLIEDLHWSDPSSVDLLRHLARRARDVRLLIIGTLRPDDVERRKHPVRNCKREMQVHRLCEEIRLPLLQPAHLASYLDARFAPNDFPKELGGLIYRTTEGHPLFSTALVQLLVERGDISRSNARWTLARPLAELDLEVPESVRGAIREKIEALDDEDQRVLRWASVQGEEFMSTVLAGMLTVDELALEQRLDRLDRVHRLIEVRDEEELPDGSLATRYRFAHTLYQQVLYEDLLSKQRASLHRQAGELLVHHHGSQTPPVAGALAIHFERGSDYARAIEFLIQAADVAMERYAAGAAEGHYSNALRLVEKLHAEKRAPHGITLLHRRGTVRVALGRFSDAEADFLRALDTAREAGDLMQQCILLNALANPFLSKTSQRDALVRAEKALAIAEQLDSLALRAEAMVNLALIHSVLGDPSVAQATFQAAIPIARLAEHPQSLLRTLTYRGVGHFFQTEYVQAEEMLKEAEDLASRLRDALMLRTALFFLGWSQANLGRISESFSNLNRLLDMARRNEDDHFLESVPRRIAWIHKELQDFAYVAPRESAEISTDAAITRRDRPDEMQVVSRRFSGVGSQAEAAEQWLARGELERAAEEARALLANSTQHGPPKYVGIAHKILAEIAVTRGDFAAAEQELRAALGPFQDHPAPLIIWKIYAALGRLHSMRNDAGATRDAFCHGAEVIHQIASTISDQRLRSTFLNAPAVQEVLRGSL
jgi:tetratricopeptide (TPR) repeat protein